MLLEYKTLHNGGEIEQVIKKSRFIGCAAPVATPEDALAFVRNVRERHPEASCNPYAFLLREQSYAKYSDDGELSGSAGLPMLEVIKKENLTDTVVAVTRYYGGIKLGAGGLLRAFANTAKAAIDAAGIVDMLYCHKYQIAANYDMLRIVTNKIEFLGGINTRVDYAENVLITTYAPHDSEYFAESLLDAANGRIDIKKTKEGIYIEKRCE